ncbi:MAG: CoA-binding protein [Candidatus Woesearchaeota archaeon]|nr:CoA-binding protein [Candidatus Woesearchaeota archaeon]
MRIAIIGASKDKDKYSNKAVRAYKSKDHVVFPVNPTEREIEGLICYNSVSEIPLDVEVASLYVPSEVGTKVADELIKHNIKKVYLNPGADSEEIFQKLSAAGIEVMRECSIKAIGMDPEKITL